jgi:hypothetical protein
MEEERAQHQQQLEALKSDSASKDEIVSLQKKLEENKRKAEENLKKEQKKGRLALVLQNFVNKSLQEEAKKAQKEREEEQRK